MLDLLHSSFEQISKPGMGPLPFCEELVNIGVLQKIDFLSARYLLREHPTHDGEILLIAFLCAASRAGHLCIRFAEAIKPGIQQIWVVDDPVLLEKCNELLFQSFKNFLKEKEDRSFLKKIDNRLYLAKNAHLEGELYKYFVRKEAEKPFNEMFLTLDTSLLTNEQKLAINMSLNHCLSFIVGGPGVGKTFTAHQLVNNFLDQSPDDLVCIAAPTGKAVANLQEKFENSSLKGKIQALTLHRLFSKKIISYLPFDLLLVDESSMIDAPFFLKLLKYAKPNSRLIFIGDPDQLPPVGVGTLFEEIMLMSRAKTTLSICQRTDLKHILESANLVKIGAAKEYTERFFKTTTHPLMSSKELASQLVKKIPMVSISMSDFEKLKVFLRYKILCAHKLGEYGSEQLNQLIHKMLKNRVAHPILITKNNYPLELFNGDLGFVNENLEGVFLPRHSHQPYVDEKTQVRKIPKELLTHFEYAYCLSVHKSQGSEYDSVSIILPSGSEVFGRELLYTAITRAKKEFELFSDIHTLTRLINMDSHKLSGLSA